MEEEYKTSLKLYKDEKIKLIEKIKKFKGNFDKNQKLLNSLTYAYEMIEKYTNKISIGNKIIY